AVSWILLAYLVVRWREPRRALFISASFPARRFCSWFPLVNATQNEIVAALRGDYASGMNKLFRHFAEKRFLHRWHLLGVHLRALAALLSWVRADDRAAPHAHHASALQLDSMSGFEGPFPIIRLADQGNPNRTFPPWLFVVNTGLVTSLAYATSNFASSSVCYSELRLKTRATTLQYHR